MASATFGNAELLAALLHADIAKLKQLHANGVSFNVSDSTYGTPLTMAISMLKPDVVEFLLDHEADPNYQGKGQSGTPLEQAVLHKEVAMVKRLLERGADPNLMSTHGGTPLISAISLENFAIVQLLVESGADVLAKNKFGVNALQAVELGRSKKIKEYILKQGKLLPQALDPEEAAKLGQVEAVRNWLESKPSTERLTTVAVAALSAGQNDVVKLLLSNGLDANAKGKPTDQNRRWPQEHLIFWALLGGNADALQSLIDAGADVNVRGTQKATPLISAVSLRKAPLVKVLLAAGADPAMQDQNGTSALALVKHLDLKQIGKILDKAVAKNPVKTANLIDAVRQGLMEQVREHLASGADTEAKDDQGVTALQWAVSMGNEPVLKLLIEKGALVQPDTIRSTWEHALSHHARPEIIQALLEGGLDVNQKHFSERIHFTPLQYAVVMVSKNVETVLDMMITAGADVHVTHTPKIPPDLMKSFEMLTQVGSPLAKKIGGTKTLLELAANNRKASTYLKTRIGVARDAYDLALEKVKQFTTALETEPMQTLVTELSATLHARPQPWKKRKGVIAFWVKLNKIFPGNETEAGEKLRQLAVSIQQQGAHLVYARLPEGSESRTTLLFFPTSDPLAVMAASGINGANYGLGTREVVKWFADISTTYPFHLIGCSYDFLDVRFKTPLIDPRGLFQKAVEFCPDMDEGAGTTAAVAEFARTGDCFFWWD